MTSLFISDLHLDPSRPDATNAFLKFLKHHGNTGRNLYILGDLFEVWIGDDDPDLHHAEVISAMANFTVAGNKGFIMRGNRDFLLGETFCNRTGFALLIDPTVLKLGGRPVLLMHGDTLCTDDVEYQAFRDLVRNPEWQSDFLEKPLEERRAFAAHARNESKAHSSRKSDVIMDVNQEAVSEVMKSNHVTWLIHGHTHRPHVHKWQENDEQMLRIVLGDWYEQGSVLEIETSQFDLKFFEL